MRILVTGSRDWTSQWLIVSELSAYWRYLLADGHKPPLVIVHGACPSGADMIASSWADAWAANDYAVETEPHPADWATHGKAAGFIRNMEMVKAGADVCLAFIRNNSHGATHCKNLALVAGIPTRIFLEDAFGRYLGEEYHS